jgi:serine/threonine protein kinase
MGEHEGRPYYAMQLVEGESLAQRLAHSGVAPLGKHDAVRYVAEIAEAVQEAHDEGILHRDIKPHNILIDRRTGRALIADFGLAQLRVDNVHGSQVGDSQHRGQAPIAGTLPYMAPEQTRSGGQASEASDVYSLGATLYQALTGNPPFPGRPGPELIGQIRNQEPMPLRQRDPSISPHLERICLKCLAKDPGQRYASAGDLAKVLRSYLSQSEAAGQVSAMGTYLIGLGPIVLLINLLAFLMLRANSPEAWIWLVTFSMYPALYSVFLLAPTKRLNRAPQVSAGDLWAPWGSKLFAAVTISVVLRVALAPNAELAILLSFPIFASLSGMAVFSSLIKISWVGATVFASGCWLTALLMLVHLPFAPLIYGVYAMVGTIGLGLYLRRAGRELT